MDLFEDEIITVSKFNETIMIRGINSPGGPGIRPQFSSGGGGPPATNNNVMINHNSNHNQQFYDDEPYQANVTQLHKNNIFQMERRETGNLIPISQRPALSNNTQAFGSAPTQSFFGGGGGLTSPRNRPQMIFGSVGVGIPQQRNSPPSDGSDKIRRFGESPTSGSYSNELDDLLIDDIIGAYDDDRRVSRPMSVGLSNDPKHQQQQQHMSMARPIPGSSRASGHSGSPIGIPNALGNNFRQVVSSSAPTSSIDIEKMMSAGSGGDNGGEDFYRDRRKKDIHNMIERRRRYNINDRIKELGQMLPKASAEDMKLNKGTILKASCDYIRVLQKDREIMMKQQQAVKSFESTAKQYADRIRELEESMKMHGVQIPPSQLPPMPRFIDRPIKQEIEDSSPTNQTPTGSFVSSSGFLSEVTNNTAAMQITSPQENRSSNNFMNTSTNSDFFSVGSASPPDYRSNWKMPSHHNFPDLMMDDLNTIQTNPLMNGGDPLISAAGAHPSPHFGQSQMSPDIHWDASGFSPDPGNSSSAGQQQQQGGNVNGGGYHQMDYS